MTLGFKRQAPGPWQVLKFSLIPKCFECNASRTRPLRRGLKALLVYSVNQICQKQACESLDKVWGPLVVNGTLVDESSNAVRNQRSHVRRQSTESLALDDVSGLSWGWFRLAVVELPPHCDLVATKPRQNGFNNMSDHNLAAFGGQVKVLEAAESTALQVCHRLVATWSQLKPGPTRLTPAQPANLDRNREPAQLVSEGALAGPT